MITLTAQDIFILTKRDDGYMGHRATTETWASALLSRELTSLPPNKPTWTSRWLPLSDVLANLPDVEGVASHGEIVATFDRVIADLEAS